MLTAIINPTSIRDSLLQRTSRPQPLLAIIDGNTEPCLRFVNDIDRVFPIVLTGCRQPGLTPISLSRVFVSSGATVVICDPGQMEFLAISELPFRTSFFRSPFSSRTTRSMPKLDHMTGRDSLELGSSQGTIIAHRRIDQGACLTVELLRDRCSQII
jgi:hypothetical protein